MKMKKYCNRVTPKASQFLLVGLFKSCTCDLEGDFLNRKDNADIFTKKKECLTKEEGGINKSFGKLIFLRRGGKKTIIVKSGEAMKINHINLTVNDVTASREFLEIFWIDLCRKSWRWVHRNER